MYTPAAARSLQGSYRLDLVERSSSCHSTSTHVNDGNPDMGIGAGRRTPRCRPRKGFGVKIGAGALQTETEEARLIEPRLHREGLRFTEAQLQPQAETPVPPGHEHEQEKETDTQAETHRIGIRGKRRMGIRGKPVPPGQRMVDGSELMRLRVDDRDPSPALCQQRAGSG